MVPTSPVRGVLASLDIECEDPVEASAGRVDSERDGLGPAGWNANRGVCSREREKTDVVVLTVLIVQDKNMSELWTDSVYCSAPPLLVVNPENECPLAPQALSAEVMSMAVTSIDEADDPREASTAIAIITTTMPTTIPR